MLFTVFTALMLLEVHGEDQKKSNALVSYKTQKTKFGPHFLQKPRARFFTKIILFNFKPLRRCIFMQILTKNPCRFFTWKTSFRPHLSKVFPKKLFFLILSFHATANSCKTSEKLHKLNFDNTWKTLFWVPFGPKTSKEYFSP